MDKLQELLTTFRDDKQWNTENCDGTHRFDKEIAWIETMIKDYAEKLHFSTDKVVEIMESKRDYSWPNYYQPANFPGMDGDGMIGVFNTFDDFREHAKNNWQGYKCPQCGDVSPSPQECIHRLKKDGKCDWCSFGLFRSEKSAIIIENGLNTIPIFEPVPKEEK